MMLGPEEYYEEKLKGKTEEQIRKEIRHLKREINRLQKIRDHPDYPYREEIIDPDEGVQQSVLRDFLEKAIEALTEAGGTYIPTKAERRAEAMAQSIPYVSKIVFTRRNFLTDFYETIFTLGENTLHIHRITGLIDPKTVDEIIPSRNSSRL